MKYFLRQIGLYLTAVWVSLTLNFILPRTMPGDPVTALIARMRGRLKPEEIEAIRIAYGFNNGTPLEQYFQYLSHALRGDFGISISAYPAKVYNGYFDRVDVDRALGGSDPAAQLCTRNHPGRDHCLAARWGIGFDLTGSDQLYRLIPLFLAGDGGPVRAGISC